MTTTTRPSRTTTRTTTRTRTRRPPSTAPRRPAATPAVPEGLRLLFDALQSDAYRAHHGPTYPAPYLQIYPALQDMRDGDREGFLRALVAAVDAEFGDWGGRPASLNAEFSVHAGFWAGVATAWFAMQALHGNGGAR